jgi:hypothetical protein
LADASKALAEGEVILAEARAKRAETEGKLRIAELSRRVAEATQARLDAETYYEKLTGVSVRKVANATESALTRTAAGAAAGAAIGGALGTVVPGIGNAVGAVAGTIIGGAIGLFSSLADSISGPSDEEKAAAQARVDQTTLAEKNAREAEAQAVADLGWCVDGQPCPATPPNGSLRWLYDQQTNQDRRRVVIASLGQQGATYQASLDIRQRTSRLVSSWADVNTTMVEMRNLLRVAQLGIERAKLETRLVESRTSATFAISQTFHGSELWTAGASLDLARRQSAKARRALEFTYGVNLSELVTDETFVASPAAWADQVYEDDLTPLRWVGKVSKPLGAMNLTPTKMESYLGNLKALDNGYLDKRDVQVSPMAWNEVFLPGPGAKENRSVRVDGFDVLATVPSAQALSWAVHCPAQSLCAPKGGYCPLPASGALRETCVGPNGAFLAPDGVKFRFHLDAWGRFNQGAPPAATANLRNGRWARFALNFTGAGLRPCVPSGPADPACSSGVNQFLYQLSALGPFVTTNASNIPVMLPLGEIQATGFAYGLGSIVRPGARGLDDSEISFLKRPEFLGYPLEGDYELVVQAGTAQDLGAIESVQIAFESTFWQPRSLNLRP